MNDFEQLLKKALSKKEPPSGFIARFQQKMSGHGRNPLNWVGRLRKFLFIPKIRWAAGALAIVLLLTFGYFQFQSHRRARLEEEWAKEQLVLALRVTHEKLALVQKKLSKLENKEIFIRIE